MNDNLLRLKKLDPELYQEIDSVKFNLVWGRDRCEPGEEYYDDILQGCLQRAIANRGWAFSVSVVFHEQPMCQIAIKKTDGTVRFYREHTDASYAVALLAAYLEAMQ